MAIEDLNHVYEDSAKTLQSLASTITANSLPRINKSNQFGEEKLISILNVIGTIGKRPSFTRIQLNKIEEDIMTCKSSKELEERVKGIIGSLETSADITLSKVVQFLLSLSNDLSVAGGLLGSLQSGTLKDFKESLMYLFINSLLINVTSENYWRKIAVQSSFLVDYAARKGDILFTVPEAYIAPLDVKSLGQDYIDDHTKEVYLRKGLDDNNRLKYCHQKNKVDYLKSIYNFFYYLSPGSVGFNHLSTWRTYFFEYEVYNAFIHQKGEPKVVRFILKFPINDKNSLYHSLAEQNYHIPDFIRREVDGQYGQMIIIKTGSTETVSQISESPLVADLSLKFKTVENALMTSFIAGLKKTSDLQFQYIAGETVRNYKSSRLAQLLDPNTKGGNSSITVDNNFIEFVHQVVKREINHESLSQILDKFCKEEELTYAFYNRENT